MTQIFIKMLILASAISLSWTVVHADPKRVKYKKVIAFPEKNEYSIYKDVESLSANGLKILVAIVVQNHSHSLPTFLASLETLDCPTLNKKCDLW